MVSENGLRDIKTRHDMVEEELSCSDSVIIICGDHLNPFSEVVNGEDDIAMPLAKQGLHVLKYMPHLETEPTVMTGCKCASGVRFLHYKSDIHGTSKQPEYNP